MASIARNVVDLLASVPLGVEAVDLFEGDLPDVDTVPGSVAAVKMYSGRPGDKNFDGGYGVTSDYPRIQILCRDAPEEYDAPLVRAMAIYTYFETHVGYVIGGEFYPVINPLQTPASLGTKDGNGRWIFSCNYEIRRNP